MINRIRKSLLDYHWWNDGNDTDRYATGAYWPYGGAEGIFNADYERPNFYVGSRLSTLVHCTEIRLSSMVVVQLRSNPGCANRWPLHLLIHVVGSG